MVDGFVTLIGGMNSGTDVAVLPAEQYARGINVTARGGLIRSRPGFTKVPVTLPQGDVQGFGVWALHDADRIVVIINGAVVVVSLSDNTVTNLGVLLDTSLQCFMWQADRFMVIQDGVSKPVVLEEAGGLPTVKALRPLDQSAEDPAEHTIPIWTGTVGAYAHGRIHMSPTVVPNTDPPEQGRPYFISGDVFKAYRPDDCLYFTETEYLNEGGAHGLPLELGYVTALAPLRNATTGTGLGGVVVFGERGVCGFDLGVPREQWGVTPIGQVLFFGNGTQSPWSVVPANGTLLYRSQDGIRAISYTASMAANSGETLANVPMSQAVDVYMVNQLLHYNSGMFIDNRLFMTAGPDATTFRGMVVLDAARIAGTRSVATEMAYDGLWQIEGRGVVGVLATQTQAFVLLDGPELWVLDPAATRDGTDRVRSRLITGLMLREGSDLKRLKSVELWLEDIRGDVQVEVLFRPAGYPLWASAGTRVFKAPETGLAQRRRKESWNLQDFADDLVCDPVLGEQLRLGQSFQIAIEWAGHMAIAQCKLEADVEVEPVSAGCPEEAAIELVPGTHGVALGDYLE